MIIITGVDTPENIDSAGKAFDMLTDALGIVRSPKPASNKCTNVDNAVEILGLEYDVERKKNVNHEVTFTVPEKKLQELKKLAQHVREKLKNPVAKPGNEIETVDIGKHKFNKQGELEFEESAALIGNASYVTCSTGTRAGVQLIRPVF